MPQNPVAEAAFNLQLSNVHQLGSRGDGSKASAAAKPSTAWCVGGMKEAVLVVSDFAWLAPHAARGSSAF